MERVANREKVRERARLWAAANREKERARRRSRYVATREAILKQRRLQRAVKKIRKACVICGKMFEARGKTKTCSPADSCALSDEWRVANRKKRAHQQRLRRAANPNRELEQQRLRRAANQEKERARRRRYYWGSVEKHRTQSRRSGRRRQAEKRAIENWLAGF